MPAEVCKQITSKTLKPFSPTPPKRYINILKLNKSLGNEDGGPLSQSVLDLLSKKRALQKCRSKLPQMVHEERRHADPFRFRLAR